MGLAGRFQSAASRSTKRLFSDLSYCAYALQRARDHVPCACRSKHFHSVTRLDCHRFLPCQEVHTVTPAAVLDKVPSVLCKGSAVDKRQALHPSPSALKVPATAKIQGDVLVHLNFAAVM